jgi:hypothetical protein
MVMILSVELRGVETETVWAEPRNGSDMINEKNGNRS